MSNLPVPEGMFHVNHDLSEAVRLNASRDDVLRIFDVSRESSILLNEYVDILSHWQKRMNLVGSSELARIWPRHIADALQLIDYMQPDIKAVVDLGSGAGIPGIILSIILKDKDVKVFLVESNSKKVAFMRQVIRQLGLQAEVLCKRIEDLDAADFDRKIDLVVSRALAPLEVLVEFSRKFVENGAQTLFHKGQDVDSELTQTTKCWSIIFTKHMSRVDGKGCILNIRDIKSVTKVSGG